MYCSFNNPSFTCPNCGYSSPVGPDLLKKCKFPEGISKSAKEFPRTGDILHKLILEEIGIDQLPGCNCQATIDWMNRIGPQGCREQIDVIVKKLNDSQEVLSWGKMISAGIAVLKNPKLLFRIGIRDPVKGLVLEAIRQAEEQI